MIQLEPVGATEKNLFKIKILDKLVTTALEFGLKESGVIVTDQLKYILSNGPRTGRVYTIRGRKHQASAPGEPPAKLTGRLVQSIGYIASGAHTLQVGEEAEYAGYLERGTKRMAPRPHLKVAVDQTQTKVMQTLIKFIDEAHK